MPVEYNDDAQEKETFFVAGSGSEFVGVRIKIEDDLIEKIHKRKCELYPYCSSPINVDNLLAHKFFPPP